MSSNNHTANNLVKEIEKCTDRCHNSLNIKMNHDYMIDIARVVKEIQKSNDHGHNSVKMDVVIGLLEDRIELDQEILERLRAFQRSINAIRDAKVA